MRRQTVIAGLLALALSATAMAAQGAPPSPAAANDAGAPAARTGLHAAAARQTPRQRRRHVRRVRRRVHRRAIARRRQARRALSSAE